MNWLSGCPAGVRFCPKDDELFCHYLYGKIKGVAFSPLELSLVQQCDLYGQEDPWTIWHRFGGDSSKFMDDLFFFTQLKKKSSDGGAKEAKRIGRTVGRHGTWSGEGKGDSFELGNVKGRKKRFHYDNPVVEEEAGRWIMHEYSLCGESGKWVLCLLRKNAEKKKKRKRDQSVKPSKKQRKPSKRQSKQTSSETVLDGPSSDSCALQLCSSGSFGYNSADVQLGQKKSGMWMQSANQCEAAYQAEQGHHEQSFVGSDEDDMWHLLDDFWEHNIGIEDLLD